MKRTLGIKINLAVLTTFLVIAVIFTVVLSIVERQRRENSVKQIGQSVSDLLLQHQTKLAEEIFSEHGRAVLAILKEMPAREGVVAAAAYDLDGGLLEATREGMAESIETDAEGKPAHPTSRMEVDGDSILLSIAPVRAFDEDVGYCAVEYSLTTLNKETRRIVLVFAALLLSLFLLMSGILGALMSRLVLGPVHKLKSVMLGVGDAEAGDMRSMSETFSRMSTELAPCLRSGDEIGDLARSFDAMLGRLSGAYEAIQAAERKYRGIFENAIEGIFRITPEGLFIDANPSMAQLLGYGTPAELLAKVKSMADDCLSDPGTLRAALAQAREKGRASDLEMEFVRRNGERFWGSMSMLAVAGPDGNPSYFEGTLADFTERLEKERAEKEREAAQAAAEARREFLDNSGQGYLSFARDLAVDPEYSLECTAIFQREDIAAEPIHELLFAAPCKAREDFAENLRLIIDEDDSYLRDLYLSLIPSEFRIGSRLVKAEYKLLDGGRILLILTDITLERELEDAVGLEKQRLAFIVSVIKNLSEFLDVTEELRTYLGEETPLLHCTSEAEVQEAFRRVHTYKGLFSLLDAINLPSALDEVETALASIRDGEASCRDVLGQGDVDTLIQAADADMEIINEALGSRYLDNKGAISLPREKKDALVDMARNIAQSQGERLDDRTRMLLAEIESLDHLDFKVLLSAYPKLVAQLAERMEKEVEPFSIAGMEVLVDPEDFIPFARSLVHVFRNAMSHGVETPEERLEAGKNPAATVSCEVSRQDGDLVVAIADDGRGIDRQALARKAEIDGHGMDLAALLFMDGLSTSQAVDETSGRGVGMSAVGEQLNRLGGSMEIHTEPGRGTTFVFRVPMSGQATKGAAIRGQQ